jgi:hypothetical protein
MVSIHAHFPSRRLRMVVLVGTILSVAVFTVGSYLTSPVTHAHARAATQSGDSGPAPTVTPGPNPGETLVTLPNCVQPPDELVVDHANFADAELTLYGLPLPEHFPGGRHNSTWITAVRAAKHRDCTLTQYANGPSFGRMSALKAQNQGADYPQNYWVGWEQNETNYQFAYANWTVPQITTQAYAAIDAPWVGMGGNGNDLLIQAGEQDVMVAYPNFLYQQLWIQNVGNHNGNPGWDPGYTPGPYYGPYVNQGDSIFATVGNGTGTGLSPASMYVEDQTTGGYESMNFGPGGFNQQYECIVERTSFNFLLTFNPITFSDCMAFTSNNGGQYITLGQNPGHWFRFVMKTGGTLCADTGSTGTNGRFTVYWHDRCTNGPAKNHP